MYKEIDEFNAYTAKPVYQSTGKRDTAWLGRFTFRTLLDFEGMGRTLTIIARGYLHRDGTEPYKNIEYARNALKAWCSVPEKTKKAPEMGTESEVNFGCLSEQFPELVDEKGNGWLYRHVKNIIKYARKNPDLVSKPNMKHIEALAGGFTTAWKKKVRQLQVPAFASNTKGAWVLRFDDILADALELGPLQNREVVLSQPEIDQLKEATPKGVPDTLLPMLMQYYIAHRHGDEEWVILPVSAVDAYYGNNNFSKKWKRMLPKTIFESKEAYGICKFKMTL